jgi:16S rRNA (adenine1518-N6/adenine1519-N6)-dimethyltransferase
LSALRYFDTLGIVTRLAITDPWIPGGSESARKTNMNLGQIKQLLRDHNIRLTKSLGQNFMHDANQIRRIVACANLTADDSILEIGPGLGPLTEVLLEKGCRVFAVEKDARMAAVLDQRFAGQSRLTLRIADAVAMLQDDADTDWSDWSVLSNLPYSVASVVLVELAIRRGAPRQIVCTLQSEVGRRLLAKPGTPEYGLLTLFLTLHYHCDDWFRVSPGCFFPEPRVDSLCLRLTRRDTPVLSRDLEPAFRDTVRRGFSQRRKMLRNLLRADWPATDVQSAMRSAALEADVRAEDLSLTQFASLTEYLVRSRQEK